MIDVKDLENNMKPFSRTSSSSSSDSESASSDHLQLPKNVISDQDKIYVVQNDFSQAKPNLRKCGWRTIDMCFCAYVCANIPMHEICYK